MTRIVTTRGGNTAATLHRDALLRVEAFEQVLRPPPSNENALAIWSEKQPRQAESPPLSLSAMLKAACPQAAQKQSGEQSALIAAIQRGEARARKPPVRPRDGDGRNDRLSRPTLLSQRLNSTTPVDEAQGHRSSAIFCNAPPRGG